MNGFRAFGCRVFQKAMKVASFTMDFSKPRLVEGAHSSGGIPAILKEYGWKKPLIVADPNVLKFGLLDEMKAALDKGGFQYEIDDFVVPNPTFECVYAAKERYLTSGCDCIVAVGGGSAMDKAKAAGALIKNPKKTIEKMKGLLKSGKKYGRLIAVPTTAGTGSEATVAAVIVNEKTRDKFSINDPKLIPQVAVLDNYLLHSLPKNVISTTGMDALTHAVEAYIGGSNTKDTKKEAIEAVRLIDKSLYAFYLDRENEEARGDMQKASYLAGLAFTRAYVGYVHALAHALGGKYNLPHGYANAVLLPHVLKAFGPKVHRRLAELADAIGLNGGNAEEKAKSFIAWIEGLNEKMDIPKTFNGVILDDDLRGLSSHADKEANPLYPVPRELNRGELEAILKEVSG